LRLRRTDNRPWKDCPITAHMRPKVAATPLNLMGLNNRALDIPGRKRLAVDYGNVITDILT
jgi:hypothetical protein